MNEKLLKPWNPKEEEIKILKMWEKSGFFNPEKCVEADVTKKDAPYFSMVLPPPNVTGVLHLGHAYENAIQDAIIRFQRMRGKKTLWIPGTDSAAIATQTRVEKNIQKEEGKNRHDLGREELIKRVSDFAKQSENTIVNQVKRMGSSLDFSRYAYTLDEKRSLAVATAFKKMYEVGLIYRGYRIVNWDPKGQTTISDDEIIYEEQKTKFYTFRYAKDFPISISTTRPETKLGDVAVAVNPEDKRYKKYIGKTFEIDDFAGVQLSIKVVGDKEADPEFGTGAVGLTPAHSATDSLIAENHNLDKSKIIINEYGKMVNTSPLTDGKKVVEAREVIVNWLKEKGLLEKEEEIIHNIATAERTGAIIEPLPKLQWFVDVNKPIKEKGGKTLKDLMREPIEKAEIKIQPEHFTKSYIHWINNLRDWCISRQIWFGHRIPVYYCKQRNSNLQTLNSNQVQILNNQNSKLVASLEKPQRCPFCGQCEMEQDEDVLDTWFSSALWTFSTLGWPGETMDLKKYHPTSLLSPGYEILFLWVSRMVMMSELHLGQIPFKGVLIHGIVRDSKGRKFSKSLGNGIDPLDIIEKYGADALRMGLLSGTAIGNDVKFDEQKIKGYKNFANKLWNIGRFVMENTSAKDDTRPDNLLAGDEKIITDFEILKKDITDDFENYRLYLSAEKIYHFTWHTFADIIIENQKPRLLKEDLERDASAYILRTIFIDTLKLIHPFMPFVTECLWQTIHTENQNKNPLMVEKWPS